MDDKEFIKKTTFELDVSKIPEINKTQLGVKFGIQFGRDNPETCEWILEKDDPNYYKCNKCGFDFVFMDGTPKENHFYYCPGENCGRKINYAKN